MYYICEKKSIFFEIDKNTHEKINKNDFFS